MAGTCFAKKKKNLQSKHKLWNASLCQCVLEGTLVHLVIFRNWLKLYSSYSALLGYKGNSLLLMCTDSVSHRHLFWPRLRARLCRKWCRNARTVGMVEMEEEALRWKVHLKGFGNNPLKLPQGIGLNGLHLDSPLCSCRGFGPHFL